MKLKTHEMWPPNWSGSATNSPPADAKLVKVLEIVGPDQKVVSIEITVERGGDRWSASFCFDDAKRLDNFHDLFVKQQSQGRTISQIEDLDIDSDFQPI